MPFGKDFELTTVRMAGETRRGGNKGRLLDAAVVSRWLALFEAEAFAVECSDSSKNRLPHNFADLLGQLDKILSLRRASGERTRFVISDDLAAFMVEHQPKKKRAQWAHCILHLCFTDEERQAGPAHGPRDKHPELQVAAAAVIAEKFFDFVAGRKLEGALADLDAYHWIPLAPNQPRLATRATEENVCAGR